jgi:hypothetical protein
MGPAGGGIQGGRFGPPGLLAGAAMLGPTPTPPVPIRPMMRWSPARLLAGAAVLGLLCALAGVRPRLQDWNGIKMGFQYSPNGTGMGL